MYGIAPVLRRDHCAGCLGVVRTLFGLPPGKPEHSRDESEESPNKVNGNPGLNPDKSQFTHLHTYPWNQHAFAPKLHAY